MNNLGTNGSICAETVPTCGVTLGALIEDYKTEPESSWHGLRYHVRQNHETLLRRLVEDYGGWDLSLIDTRDIKGWYRTWTKGGEHLATGALFVGKLRTIMTHGVLMLPRGPARLECGRIKEVLRNLKVQHSPPRKTFITAEQATAIREKAREIGWYSIALAQALQFELILRQKDVIGEWVPLSEPGISDVNYLRRGKWLRGLRWSEIDGMILTHVTSKRQKELVVDLNYSPMVLDEFRHVIDLFGALPKTGPIVVCEATGIPYVANEFRRKWRIVAEAAGVPKEVFNMDSRSGGITEASDAEAEMEHIRHAATHSDLSMTARYSRNSAAKVTKVQQKRLAHRAALTKGERA